MDEKVLAFSEQLAEAVKKLGGRLRLPPRRRVPTPSADWAVGGKGRHWDRAAERRAHRFGEDRISDEIHGEQVHRDAQKAPKPNGCGIRETPGVQHEDVAKNRPTWFKESETTSVRTACLHGVLRARNRTSGDDGRELCVVGFQPLIAMSEDRMAGARGSFACGRAAWWGHCSRLESGGR